MPAKKFKSIQNKQLKESARKKIISEVLKNPKKLDGLKKSKPIKEFYKEFKRLINIYSESSKVVNADSLDNIKLAKDELLHHLSLNLEKSYSYAFIYIRQLAITLRKAIADKKKTAVYAVYNWQFLKNLELWNDFIVEHFHTNDNIKTLVHPLVQLTSGIIRLRPSARWLPMRFHCLKMLNQINYSCENLTPVMANIIEIFNSVNFNMKTKRDSKKTINLMVMLHFSTSQLQTFEHLEQTLDQVFQLIVENLVVYSRSPNFPEYVAYLTSVIRSFTKKCRESMFSKAYRSLIKKIDAHSLFVVQQRARNPNAAKIDNDPIFDKFVENYRVARLHELETIIKATQHSKYEAPHDDYEDKEKDFDADEKDQEDEPSELDEDEFQDDLDDGSDSAVEIE